MAITVQDANITIPGGLIEVWPYRNLRLRTVSVTHGTLTTEIFGVTN